MIRLRWLLLAGTCAVAAACAERHDPSANNKRDAEASRERCDAGGCEADESTPPVDGSVPARCAKLAPAENPAREICTLGSLDEFCVRAADAGLVCPETIEEAGSYLCNSYARRMGRYRVHCNACGGVNVMTPYGFGYFSFSFAADETLIGATMRDDTPSMQCGEFERVHGTFCPETEEFSQYMPVPCE